ncbi:MAG: hypothetical protein HOA30_03850 [Rhodospirillaceae bacterium]|nr:hypothetical protein [Rhodospirillaceae bacterium]
MRQNLLDNIIRTKLADGPELADFSNAVVCATSLTFRSTKMGINTATTTRLIATIIGVGAKIIQTILRRPDPRSAIR